jgi:hypothetical protein
LDPGNILLTQGFKEAFGCGTQADIVSIHILVIASSFVAWLTHDVEVLKAWL